MSLSLNFVKDLKFSWPRSLAKFQILTTFWTLSFLTCEWIAGLKMVFLVSFCWFEVFVEVWAWVKILSKIENFHDSVLSEISDFDHFLNIVISDLWVNLRFQNGILKCSFGDFKDLWKFEF